MDKKTIERLRRQSPVAFTALSRLLYQEDPIAINLGINPEEYDAEAAAILPRLWECASPADIHGLIYREFIRSFGADIAGRKERYARVAQRVWGEMPGWIDYPLGHSETRLSALSLSRM